MDAAIDIGTKAEAIQIERAVQARLRPKRINGEWYRVDVETMIHAIKLTILENGTLEKETKLI